MMLMLLLLCRCLDDFRDCCCLAPNFLQTHYNTEADHLCRHKTYYCPIKFLDRLSDIYSDTSAAPHVRLLRGCEAFCTHMIDFVAPSSQDEDVGPWMQSCRAHCFMLSGDSSAARKAVDAALEEDEPLSRAFALFIRGRMHIDQLNTTQAQDCFMKAARIASKAMKDRPPQIAVSATVSMRDRQRLVFSALMDHIESYDATILRSQGKDEQMRKHVHGILSHRPFDVTLYEMVLTELLYGDWYRGANGIVELMQFTGDNPPVFVAHGASATGNRFIRLLKKEHDRHNAAHVVALHVTQQKSRDELLVLPIMQCQDPTKSHATHVYCMGVALFTQGLWQESYNVFSELINSKKTFMQSIATAMAGTATGRRGAR